MIDSALSLCVEMFVSEESDRRTWFVRSACASTGIYVAVSLSGLVKLLLVFVFNMCSVKRVFVVCLVKLPVLNPLVGLV